MVINAAGGPIPNPRMAGFGTQEDAVDTWEQALRGREYLADARFTAANLLIAEDLGTYLKFGLLEKRETFVALALLHQSREAMQWADAIDSALLAK